MHAKQPAAVPNALGDELPGRPAHPHPNPAVNQSGWSGGLCRVNQLPQKRLVPAAQTAGGSQPRGGRGGCHSAARLPARSAPKARFCHPPACAWRDRRIFPAQQSQLHPGVQRLPGSPTRRKRKAWGCSYRPVLLGPGERALLESPVRPGLRAAALPPWCPMLTGAAWCAGRNSRAQVLHPKSLDDQPDPRAALLPWKPL